MQKNKFILLFFFITICCKSQINFDQEIISIKISNIKYSKIPPKYDRHKLSKITNIDAENFSSGISGISEGKEVDFPINDKLFNHNFFKDFDFDSDLVYKLFLQKYRHDGKVYLIAMKIE